MKYQSLTTPTLEHDIANLLTEMIFLNRDIKAPPYVWKTCGRDWGKTVSVIKKMMRDFELTADQIAFYIHRCRPVKLDGVAFGKMAVVAKKLFQRYDLQSLIDQYESRRADAMCSSASQIKERGPVQRPKSLAAFLKELADGQKEAASQEG